MTAPNGRETGRNRLELCQRLIEETMKCLENNDRQCAMRLIEELVRAECYDGRLIGKEVADGVREITRELWLRSDNECRCDLLRMFSFNITKGWLRNALVLNLKDLNKWLVRCGIDLKGRAKRSEVVKRIEDLLRRLGWSEVKMCERLFKFIGIDVEVFRRHGIEPCVWLNGLETLHDLRRPYWLGLRASDLAVWKGNGETVLELTTTNAIDAVFFAKLLSTVKVPNLNIGRTRGAKSVKYVHEPIELIYFIVLNVNAWPWSIKLSADELERILDGFSDEELAMFVAGVVDGDGSVWYVSGSAYMGISACKDCPKRMMLDVLKEVIAKRFGIVGSDGSLRTVDALVFGGEKAVKLLRLIRPFVHHPLRRLRIELILALYDGRISREAFEKLYEMTEYELGGPDVKRNNALEALARAAPQTHTHGRIKHKPKN